MTLPPIPTHPGTPARLVHPGAFPRLHERHARPTGQAPVCRLCRQAKGTLDVCQACSPPPGAQHRIRRPHYDLLAYAGVGEGARYAGPGGAM